MLRDWARAEPEVGGRQLADSLMLDGRQLMLAKSTCIVTDENGRWRP